ncbi:hypothetical protein Nekkels1_34 [Cellulophaga phage Nekkels_1]|uniref:Uncharacterized protein n=1 Tax=Cellulophaga phage Nekkels_1 TaxID=2745692 RepID=A0A8E4XZM0_9CAUD|nr:hypothetical protein M1M31_gp34 [Cellulophaga phage Nekkels_1]QQO97035.1 hypothetical protein Nekkels1_34 [Cellulophaga phage Nekkels_1]QQO97128.1 hypothetical protein Nekkels2_34 [Cellulophaga phage Nekkels_2]
MKNNLKSYVKWISNHYETKKKRECYYLDMAKIIGFEDVNKNRLELDKFSLNDLEVVKESLLYGNDLAETILLFKWIEKKYK